MLNNIVSTLTKDKKLIIVWSIVSCLIGVNWLVPVLSILLRAIPELTNLMLARIIATLLFLSIGLFASLIILHKKIKLKPDFSKYIHSPEEGCWLNPDDPEDRICSVCKIEDIKTPLEHFSNYWHCPIHKRAVGSPRKELPPKQPNKPRGKSWVRDY